MTLIVAVRSVGRVAVVADRVIHWGDHRSSPDNSSIVKVAGFNTGVGPDRVRTVMATVGDTRNTYILRELATYQTTVPRTTGDVAALGAAYRALAIERGWEWRPEKSEWAGAPSGLLVANRYGLWNVDSVGSADECQRYFAVGSGDKLAEAAVEALLAVGLPGLTDAREVALRAYRAAAVFTSCLGEPFVEFEDDIEEEVVSG